MTFENYLAYIEWRSALLMAGRYDDLVSHYKIPVAMDLAGVRFDIDSRDDLILHLHRLRLALVDRGVRRLEPDITAVGLPDATQRVWVRWRALAASGALWGSSETIYHMDRSASGLRVAAMEHPTLLVPEFAKAHFRNRLIRSRS